MGVSVWYYTTLPTVDGGFFNNNPEGFKRMIEDLGGWIPDDNKMIGIDIDVLADYLNELVSKDQEEAFEYDSNCSNGLVYAWLVDAINHAEVEGNYIYFTIN